MTDSGRGLVAVVGLGSNYGNRLAFLRAAVKRVERFATVERVSRVYETAPIGGPPQSDYLNAAVRISYGGGGPHALLDELAAVETVLGRVRVERWAARSIDLDILWIEGIVVNDERLTVPHPLLTSRAFALLPMFEVAPAAIDPRTGAPFPVAPEDQRVRLTEFAL